jgi:recombination protein RecR
MPSLPPSLVGLIAALRRLPGIGARSAERIALHLVQSPKEDSAVLAEAIGRAREAIRFCSICGALTEGNVCDVCSNPRRDHSLICVVEQPVDVLSVEKSGTYHGLYHVLGGKIAPLDGVGPDDLRIGELEQRLSRASHQEVVIALATDVEGDATSRYLAQRLARPGLKITRIAHGLPAGAGLEFADELTLSRALEGRRESPGPSSSQSV